MSKFKLILILIALGVLGYYVIDQVYTSVFMVRSSDYQSNGERIYFTAASSSGKPIVPRIGTTMTSQSGLMSCSSCHHADGRGGPGNMMSGIYSSPNIRYSVLTGGNPPYTDDLIKRAIIKGVDQQGKTLESPMPVWNMSEEDLNDLMTYLKTLK
ncbi:MAG: cytochrome c [Candidatus Methanoperedens sp.]|nr:cytochrome c [Candidatus Methanoperedens sp.]